MAFASNADRLALVNSSIAFNACPFVVRVRTKRGESEIACDDFDHAFDTAHDWKARGAEYVEMFRVDEMTGSLYGGIGAF